jgi:hypothetical protein
MTAAKPPVPAGLDLFWHRNVRRSPLCMRPLPILQGIDLDSLRLSQLRQAIRRNRVSFPAQVPTFEKHDRADLQWKLVQLYFVFGWSSQKIGCRYNLPYQRVGQILATWKRRAIQTGFVQYIAPADVAGSADLTAVLHQLEY